jgi:hypothetical protein
MLVADPAHLTISQEKASYNYNPGRERIMNKYRYAAAMVIALLTASTELAQALHIKVRLPNPKHPFGAPLIVVTGATHPNLPISHQRIQAALSIRIPKMPKVPTTEEALRQLGLGMNAYCVKYRDPALPDHPIPKDKTPPPQTGVNQPPEVDEPPTGPNPNAPWKKETFHSRLGEGEVKIRTSLNVGDGNIDWVKSGGCESHPEN